MEKQNCIFCQIIAGELKSTIIWQDDEAIAIHDLYPQAPCHILVIPKQHYTDVTTCTDPLLLGNLLKQAAKLAELENLSSGFRLVINTGAQAGQSVGHIHIHLLGGRKMQWPPG